ncbi:MAG: exopolysaccharide biosynthesis polyprenyl glycosylphosphotransferase, partial [Syntrophomonadaceae bacterium]|nr:exopolysaccharide biosynthesis polyprenyl glycosylphosphotransferase [Syntrophomonadaceae bacterium]
VQGRQFPILGVFRDSKALMERTGATHMVVAAPNLEPNSLVGLVNRLHREGATVMLIPNLRGLPLTGMEVEYFFNEQMMSLRIRNNLASGFNRAMKRVFDLGVGSLILVAILPLMALVALAIKLDSPGPVTFAHRRIGRGGREFNCYKFRSMVVNADAVLQQVLDSDPALREEWERNFKLRRDPRVTRVGRLLRATSLDELPQIFNVLKGEMSLVGPRPIVASEVPRFTHYIADYYQVCPGMTGLWQVSGRSEIEYSSRIRLESWYIRNWSLWLDVSLLFRTIAVVLGKRGAY